MSPTTSARRGAADDRLGVVDHLVHRDPDGRLVAEHRLAERVADQEHRDAGLVEQLRGREVVGGQHRDPLAVGMHPGDVDDGHAGGRRLASGARLRVRAGAHGRGLLRARASSLRGWREPAGVQGRSQRLRLGGRDDRPRRARSPGPVRPHAPPDRAGRRRTVDERDQAEDEQDRQPQDRRTRSRPRPAPGRPRPGWPSPGRPRPPGRSPSGPRRRRRSRGRTSRRACHRRPAPRDASSRSRAARSGRGRRSAGPARRGRR